MFQVKVETLYSGTGYNPLELMIDDCPREDFSVILWREVFEPLGMQTATFDWPGLAMPVGHDLHGRPVAPYVYTGRGSGGLFATADDMAGLAAAGMVGAAQTVLSRAGMDTRHQPVTPAGGVFAFAADGYALGSLPKRYQTGGMRSGMAARATAGGATCTSCRRRVTAS